MTTEINPERRAHELQEAEELLQERTEMLFDACWALDCLNFFEPLEDNKHDILRSAAQRVGYMVAGGSSKARCALRGTRTKIPSGNAREAA